MVVYVIVIIQNVFFLLSVLLAVVVTHFFSLDVLKKNQLVSYVFGYTERRILCIQWM